MQGINYLNYTFRLKNKRIEDKDVRKLDIVEKCKNKIATNNEGLTSAEVVSMLCTLIQYIT